MAFLSDYFNYSGNTGAFSNSVTAGNVVTPNAIIINGQTLTALPGNVVLINNTPLISADSTANISTTGDITAGQFIVAAGGNITFPDGSVQTSALNYSNANVQAFLPTYSGDIANLDVTGQLTAVTQANADSSGNVATTEFVQNVVTASGGYGDAQVEALLAGGNVSTDIITTGELTGATGIIGAYANPGDFFVRNDGTSVSMGQFAAQSITVGSGGIQIAGTGGVDIQGVATANIDIGGGTTGSVNFPKGLYFGDGTYQNTAGGGSSYGNAEVADYLANGSDPTIVAIDSSIANTNANVATLTSTVANTDANVATLTSTVANTDANVASLTSTVSNNSSNIATLQGNVVLINSELANTAANVATLQGNVVTLSSELANTNANVATLQGNITTINSEIANLTANTYTDANVAAYLPTYTGALSGNGLSLGTGNLTLSGNAISLTSQDIVLDPVADGSNFGNVIVLGNLSVTGNTYSTNPVIAVTNNLIWQAANNAATATDASGGGMAVGPVGNAYASLTFNSVANVWNSSLGIHAAGDISTAGNITGAYLYGNGSGLTGMYGNTGVADYLANGSDATIVALQTNVANNTANITALQSEAANTAANVSTLQGNITTINSEIANLTANTYTDANVATYLASNANVVITTTGNITTTANVTADYFIGNGSQLTGLPAGYSDANVATYLASGNVTTDITTTANVTAAYLLGNIANATGLGNIATINLNGNVSEVLAGDGTWVVQSGGTGTYGNANVAAYLPTYNGNLGNVGIANTAGVLMGTPTQGNLISNAVSLTTTTALTDSIALLNNVLGKLVPPAPPAFPASQSLTISGLSTYRMANIVQINNTGNSLTVSAGTTVANARRVAAYTTNTISTAGPGDSGTVTSYLSGSSSGTVTLNGASNGTYGNLIISANQDYHAANANITAGFWSVFSASLSGTAQAGWNDVAITDTAAGNTNAPSWYYDNSSPATPAFSSTSFAAGTTASIYSSTVPHYTNATQFNIGFTVANVSGNMYPTSNTFVTGTAGGAFQAPVSVSYNQSSLASNVIPSFATAVATTTANVAAGFGASSGSPSVTVNNSYNSGSQSFAPGVTVLYKTGTAGSLTFLEEANLFVGGTIGSGVTGAVTRIVNPGSSDTPSFSGTEANFNSQTGPLETYDAAVVGGVLSCNKTNYSTGYLPVGPNLSTQDSTQYFTFKFVAPSTSKFDVYITGTIAGLYVALPGSGIDTSSTLNGWMDASIAYAGAGQPGAGTGGNGSNGCALGTVVPINTAQTARRTTCTFGTTGTAASIGNEVYVRIKLTTGQSITSLAIYPASN